MTSKKLKQKKPTTRDKSTDPPRVIFVYFRIRFNILEIQYYNRKIALRGDFSVWLLLSAGMHFQNRSRDDY